MFKKSHNPGDKTPRQDNQDNKQAAALKEASAAKQPTLEGEKTAPAATAPAANDEKKS